MGWSARLCTRYRWQADLHLSLFRTVYNKDGLWTPVEAQKFIDFSAHHGTPIAAELFNEPTMPIAGGAFSNTEYGADEYVADVNAFEAWRNEFAPSMVHVGPGVVGEGVDGFSNICPANFNPITTEQIMTRVPQIAFDICYHYYGAASMRVAKEPP